MNFKELKEELLRRAKAASACEDGYRMGLLAESKADLLKAITDNWCWVLSTARIVDTAFFEEHFTEEELTAAGICLKGHHSISDAYAFAYGSSTVKAYGSSTVEAYDSSTVKAYGSSTVKAYDSSTVEAYDESYVEDCRGGLRPSGDRAIVKDYYGRKLYIKKGAFEIIEVN